MHAKQASSAIWSYYSFDLMSFAFASSFFFHLARETLTGEMWDQYLRRAGALPTTAFIPPEVIRALAESSSEASAAFKSDEFAEPDVIAKAAVRELEAEKLKSQPSDEKKNNARSMSAIEVPNLLFVF